MEQLALCLLTITIKSILRNENLILNNVGKKREWQHYKDGVADVWEDANNVCSAAQLRILSEPQHVKHKDANEASMRSLGLLGLLTQPDGWEKISDTPEIQSSESQIVDELSGMNLNLKLAGMSNSGLKLGSTHT